MPGHATRTTPTPAAHEDPPQPAHPGQPLEPSSPLLHRNTMSSCGEGVTDAADVRLTVTIIATDVEDLPGLISEVRKAVKRGEKKGDLQFCSGACRFEVSP